MCTAVSFLAKEHYFGRTLDLEYSYDESVTITPRKYPFHFRFAPSMLTHHAMIGMAYTLDGYPLYYDATNEKGLSMAGLNFPGNAHHHVPDEKQLSIAPFEFIPWMLGQCENVGNALDELEKMVIVQENFRDDLPATPLHWIISDAKRSVTVECMAEGMRVYDNPVGVLTNNPPFDYHMLRLADYMNITSEHPENRFVRGMELRPYSLGMGGIGLPGDLSSSSRFVRAAFVKCNSQPAKNDSGNIGQFFHILDAVTQPKGCSKAHNGLYEYTIYSSCCNTTHGVYYYKTYDNSQITGIDMHAENLDGSALISYPLVTGQQILMQNVR